MIQSETNNMFDHLDNIKRDVIPAAAEGTMNFSIRNLIVEEGPEPT